ncbi:MAG: hypothetical protein Hals2KO_35950 [Halioglobus sp.]
MPGGAQQVRFERVQLGAVFRFGLALLREPFQTALQLAAIEQYFTDSTCRRELLFAAAHVLVVQQGILEVFAIFLYAAQVIMCFVLALLQQ